MSASPTFASAPRVVPPVDLGRQQTEFEAVATGGPAVKLWSPSASVAAETYRRAFNVPRGGIVLVRPVADPAAAVGFVVGLDRAPQRLEA